VSDKDSKRMNWLERTLCGTDVIFSAHYRKSGDKWRIVLPTDGTTLARRKEWGFFEAGSLRDAIDRAMDE